MLIRDQLFNDITNAVGDKEIKEAIDKHLKIIADTIAQLAVYPGEGYCFCSCEDARVMDNFHEQECVAMRTLLREGFGL